jgi:TorA maturation chaperone TorD
MATQAAPPLARLDAAALDRALARADAYRVLAAAFRDPDDPGAEGELDLASVRSAAVALGSPVAPATFRALRRIAGRDARAAEHRAIFGHVVAHGCPPYETEYGRRHVFGQSQELGDIRGFYEAFGVRPRPGGERPDHVACELEFLALLALKEAIATARHEDDRRALCREAAARFVQDHGGQWLPALAGRIARRAPASGYAAAAAVVQALVAGHARELGVAPRPLDPDDVVPITDEPDGFTFECGVDVERGDMAPPGSG